MKPRRRVWTAAEVLALGVRTDVPTAGEIIAGLGRDESYRAVKAGRFPVPVLEVGRHLVVPVAPIVKLLELDAEADDATSREPSDPAAMRRRGLKLGSDSPVRAVRDGADGGPTAA